METNIQLFNSPQFGDIRTAGTPDNPLFCAVDIARALGYSNPAKAVIDHCKGVTVLETPTNGGLQSIKYISEPDMYRLIFKSNAPNAEQFNSWVSEEVLPSIRKTGGYIPAKVDDTPEEIMAKALLIANKTMEVQKQRIAALEEQKKMLEHENTVLAPKAAYTDEVLQSTSTYTHTQMAKELNFKSVTAFLQQAARDNILYKQSGMWMLYSRYAGKGYMKVRTTPYRCSDGTVKTNSISVWTEEGRSFLHKHFNVEFQPIDMNIPWESDM